ncbi:Hypothetical_protein [Hexamita inflata]|uniref:Hypothetical_protein n=1 Tax=Hexamita inflata TaxID=28002 RepID=A0AA86PC73_9EUKA|nr:Hypothetical protein HINF_LOCUS23518 [Hexamita inflata]
MNSNIDNLLLTLQKENEILHQQLADLNVKVQLMQDNNMQSSKTPKSPKASGFHSENINIQLEYQQVVQTNININDYYTKRVDNVIQRAVKAEKRVQELEKMVFNQLGKKETKNDQLKDKTLISATKQIEEIVKICSQKESGILQNITNIKNYINSLQNSQLKFALE